MTDKVRLQRFLSDAGICSRRAAEKLISDGRVSVNGKVVLQLGTKVNPGCDSVSVDGSSVELPADNGVVIVLNKPRGYITSTSARQGKTVYDLIPEYHPRLLPIGRLDKDSEGVLLMTNRNELISELTHPRNQHEKHYQATVSGSWNEAILKRLNSPMTIDGERMSARVTELRKSGNESRLVLQFILTEGKNRQIRRMCDAVGLAVHRLVRTSFARVDLDGLRSGNYRKIDLSDLPAHKETAFND
jgi:23S rRNA pseudouridine2605 synthase